MPALTTALIVAGATAAGAGIAKGVGEARAARKLFTEEQERELVVVPHVVFELRIRGQNLLPPLDGVVVLEVDLPGAGEAVVSHCPPGHCWSSLSGSPRHLRHIPLSRSPQSQLAVFHD